MEQTHMTLLFVFIKYMYLPPIIIVLKVKSYICYSGLSGVLIVSRNGEKIACGLL